MRIFRITTSTTTTLTSETWLMKWLRVSVIGSPNNWHIRIQNKESPAKVFHTSFPVDGPMTVQVPFPVVGDRTVPVPMTGGIDIVTEGATPGTADVWIEGEKANQ